VLVTVLFYHGKGDMSIIKLSTCGLVAII